jgi:hypothetical protein
MERSKASIRRCAIYTRKSSEQGLEQDFNSLQAQREACEAFIKSQAGEGWRLVKTAYDDGGLSGGTMERPAVQRLLADVNQGVIDVVVVYKVDRLTRSLSDFAKMVEVFDAHKVSFVQETDHRYESLRLVGGAERIRTLGRLRKRSIGHFTTLTSRHRWFESSSLRHRVPSLRILRPNRRNSHRR